MRLVAGGAAESQLSMLTRVGAVARLEGVNKPELLPREFSTVIDVAGFLTEGEVREHMAPACSVARLPELHVDLCCLRL